MSALHRALSPWHGLLALWLAPCALAAPQTWVRQYPVEVPFLRDVATDGAGLVVAVGDFGAVLRSTDGGLTWSEGNVQPGTPTGRLEEVEFCGTTCLAAGDGIWRSADGGLTWSRTDTATQVEDLCTLGGGLAWAVTLHGDVLRSTDSGATWASATLPPAFWSEVYSISFRDATWGWVGGQGGALFQTNDGGASWILRSSPTNWSLFGVHWEPTRSFLMEDSGVWRGTGTGPGWSFEIFPWITGPSHFAFEGQVGLAVGYFGRIQRTPNSGLDWVLAHEDVGWQHGGVAHLGNGVAVVVGEGSRVLRSTDEGRSWGQVHGATGPVPPNRWLGGMDAVDADTAYIAASDGVVLHTTDRGQTWVEQDAGTAQTHLREVDFVDPMNGYAVGAKQGFYPTLCSTHDGGVNWHEHNQLGMYDHHDIVAVSATEAIAASDTRLWRTTDGGLSWGSTTPLPYATYRAIDMVGAVGLAAGSALVRTSDGGATWTHLRTLSADAYGLDMFDDQVGWMVGEGGMVERTLDGGLTWTPMSSGVSTDLLAVSARTASLVAAAGADGVVIVSGNGGVSWTRLDPPGVGAVRFEGCTFTSEGLWVSGQDAGVWYLGAAAPQCEVENYCTGKPHSGGGTARMTLFGHPSVANGFIGVGVEGAVPSQFAMAFWSASGAATTPLHGGTLCVAAPLFRLPVVQLGTNGFAFTTVAMDPTFVGATHRYQFFFRDPLSPDGTGIGMSDGLRVSFCP